MNTLEHIAAINAAAPVAAAPANAAASAAAPVAAASPAGEMTGQRMRPYDMRWGTPEMIKETFGINPPALKAAWARGWVRARQGNWERDDKRTQTVFCFEDIHVYMERCMHVVSDEYVRRWWTDDEVSRLADKLPDGPYTRSRRSSNVRRDGYPKYSA